MKAFVLVPCLLGCAACSTAPVDMPLGRYGGPPMADAPNFDRAGIDVILGTFAAGRQPDGDRVILSSPDGHGRKVTRADVT